MIKNKKTPKPYKKGKSKSKKTKKGKRKQKPGIQATGAFRFVSTARRSPFQRERWPEDSPTPNPRRQVQLIREARKLEKIVQDLKRRIEALPMKNRKVPESVDPKVLGVELKLRLAAKSPVIVEKTGSDGKVQIERRRSDQRFVPLYNINDQSDCRISCLMKLNRKRGTYRRVPKPI
ncbi:uncharacterized protein LOC124139410 [Haliotis rufescens]|uniref:uncharacterized protein LOC124139410 n=1 Tax=Haliotis rufescens TaxID=6454 RepID=UPI00201F8E1C|nr:uncharacterized protein LOC124139410 [Haliotis rufescens]